MPNQQRRAYYRLRYPLTERPTLEVAGRRYTVSEISEGGIRVTLSDAREIGPIGCEIDGVLEFPDDTTSIIEGVVQRLGPREAVLRLSQGVSFRKMIAEQTRLHRTYPDMLKAKKAKRFLVDE